MNEYPVGDWSPSLPGLTQSSGPIERMVSGEIITRPTPPPPSIGHVWYDPERSQFICQGVTRHPDSPFLSIEDFIVRKGVTQVWIKQNYIDSAPDYFCNSFIADGPMYFSSSGCTTSASIDCRLCATLTWTNNQESADVVNHIPDLLGMEYNVGLVRSFE